MVFQLFLGPAVLSKAIGQVIFKRGNKARQIIVVLVVTNDPENPAVIESELYDVRLLAQSVSCFQLSGMQLRSPLQLRERRDHLGQGA